MDRKEFNESFNGKKKRHLSMLVVKIHLECSCNTLFFTTLATTELVGDFSKKCPLCKRTHTFCWDIQTRTEEEDISQEE